MDTIIALKLLTENLQQAAKPRALRNSYFYLYQICIFWSREITQSIIFGTEEEDIELNCTLTSRIP
jgi:hypothetical protein